MALRLPIDQQCCRSSQQLVQRWIVHEVLRKGLLFSRAPLALSHLSVHGKTGKLRERGLTFSQKLQLFHSVSQADRIKERKAIILNKEDANGEAFSHPVA